jgi:hypothetical protein
MAEWGMTINVADAIGELDEFAKALPNAVGRGMYGFSEQVMTRAKELCPVDTGTLKSSGHVAAPKANGRDIEIVLGFGGPAGSGNQGETNSKDCGYADYVHENLAARHENGQAKFLESPLVQAAPQMAEQVQNEVDAEIKELFK